MGTGPEDTQEIATRIRRILVDQARLAASIDEIGDEGDLHRWGMTSHANVNVMLALEEEFDIEFPDEMLRRETFESVTAIRGAVSILLGDRLPA